MLRVRIALLVFFFMFVVVTETNATSMGGARPASFGTASVGATISGKWDAPEGNGTTLAVQVAHILAGRSYINFDTTPFTGAEIRGAILLVPEPAAVILLGVGILIVAFFCRRGMRKR